MFLFIYFFIIAKCYLFIYLFSQLFMYVFIYLITYFFYLYFYLFANRHQAGTTPRSHVINISPPAAKGIESNAPLAQDPQTA